MEVKKIQAGELLTNCYIVMDEATRDGFVLDPGGEAQRIINEVEAIGVHIKFILLTHGHFDHTGAAIELSSRYEVPIYLNLKDLAFVEAKEQLYIMNKYDKNKIKGINESIKLKVGTLEIKCLETPGHTPGGVCYLIDNVLFAGDTLFAGSIGRTDFYGGNHSNLLESIKNKLFLLSDNIIVKPGHGRDTTIGHEKNFNPFF